MTLTRKQILAIIFTGLLLLILPAAIFLSQKRQEIRPKASPVVVRNGSTFVLQGPPQVKAGEKFSVDLVLDTTNDFEYTISSVVALIYLNPQWKNYPTPPICLSPGPCPAYDLPPDFCKGGKIITPLIADICGCAPPPKCIMPVDDKQLNVSSDQEQDAAIRRGQEGQYYPMPPYYNQAISLVDISPGKIFDNYFYPGSSGSTCGGIAGLHCPDGYYCSYGGANIKGLYPDQMGMCLPISYRPLPLQAGEGESSRAIITGTVSRIGDIVCTHDAKQCPDGSWVGRTGPNCEFASCPNPPYYGNNQFKISGAKNFSVNEKGYFKGFTGKGVFATLYFMANYPGKVEIQLIPGSSIKGYRKSEPADTQKPIDRLFSGSLPLNIEVVSDKVCVPPPDCSIMQKNTDGSEISICALMGAPAPGTVYCTPTITPHPGCWRKKEGDSNCDGKTDGIDYSIWLNSQCYPFGNQVCSDFRADFNSDKKVDDKDYKIWFNNKGS